MSQSPPKAKGKKAKETPFAFRNNRLAPDTIFFVGPINSQSSVYVTNLYDLDDQTWNIDRLILFYVKMEGILIRLEINNITVKLFSR